ncbi:MAG: LysM peptidoglycan-binding domain-containing protein [Epsilonproteobacteria bacterium]|nr:LysM peptidoglycan-binding domain-containing protein [Campylobacterota bacterium]
MVRVVLVAVLLNLTLLFGKVALENSYQIEEHVLKSMDIPREYFYSKPFLRVKKRYEKYKRLNFFNLDRVETYFIPDLVRILNDYDIPDVFLFLAMAESNFISHAKSHKQAVGIWQFMKWTARKYGLRVDSYVDERKDPYKSTYAAARYLTTLYRMFGKWYLAAFAYNAGEGTVLKAIRKAGTDDVMVLSDPRKKYLPRESREYLAKIVMLALMSSDERYHLGSELAYIFTRSEEYEIVPVNVRGPEDLDYVARTIKMNSRFLHRLNPHLKLGITPPNVKEYPIYIPKLKYGEFVENYTPSPLQSVKRLLAKKLSKKKRKARTRFITYKVKRGDTLYRIARRYGVKISQLKKINSLKSNFLRSGQKIKIPVSKKYHRSKKRKRIYKVKKGDTLFKIAKKFRTDPRKIKAWNGKRSNFLKVGERLVILY